MEGVPPKIKKLCNAIYTQVSFILWDTTSGVVLSCCCCCCCCLDRSGSSSTPAWTTQFLCSLFFFSSSNQNNRKMSLSLSCHWIFFYFSFLASHWWAATRRGIVGMLRISDSFSRPYQWTLVITLSLSPAARLLIWWWWWRLFNISFSLSRRDRNRLKTIHKTKTFFAPAPLKLFFFVFLFFSGPFLLFFLGEFSPSEGVGSVCLLSVAGRRTQVTQIHNTKRRKNLFFFYFFIILLASGGAWPFQ